MKIKLFILIFLFSGCGQAINRLHLKKIKKKLENCTWDYSFEYKGVAKKECFVFKEFRLDKNRLICFAVYNGNPSNYEGYYFEYSRGKISKCFSRSQVCGEICFVKDTIFSYYRNDEGKTAIAKYVKRK
jgi:hypothetical protein